MSHSESCDHMQRASVTLTMVIPIAMATTYFHSRTISTSKFGNWMFSAQEYSFSETLPLLTNQGFPPTCRHGYCSILCHDRRKYNMSSTPIRFLSPPSGRYIWHMQQQWICLTWTLLLLVKRWLTLPMKNVSTTVGIMTLLLLELVPGHRGVGNQHAIMQFRITMHTGRNNWKRSPLEHYVSRAFRDKLCAMAYETE